MDQNVGQTDQIVRIVLGAVTGLLSIGILTGFTDTYFQITDIASPILGVVSLVLLATGFMGKCYLYNALGMDTSE